MKRKVVQQGPATLMVSLPSKWAKRCGIKRGDEIEVTEKDSSLNISIHRKEEIKEATIQLISSDEWYVDQTIRNLYTSGYDEIKVKFEDPKTILVIQTVVDKLIGFEIIEQKEENCLIKSVSKGMEENLNSIFRKVFLIVVNQFDKILNDIKNNNREYAVFKQMNDNARKFSIFCRRLINKTDFNESKKIALYVIMMRSSMISSTLTYLYHALAEKKKIEIKKESLNFLIEAQNDFRIIYDVFYKKNIENLEKLKNRRILIQNALAQFLKKNKGIDSVIVHYATEIIRLASAMGGYVLKYCVD
jgi:antitoxin component of MazEF toxin-antitoxin module